jgi:hypothetical protein
MPAIGRAEKALEAFLQLISVQRQAYFGGAFVGNHVEKLLRNLEGLWAALRAVASEMDRELAIIDSFAIIDPSSMSALGVASAVLTCWRCKSKGEASKAVEAIIARVSPFWNHFALFHHECRKTRLLSPTEITSLCDAATGLVNSSRSAYPATHVELKLHVIEAHVPPFVKKWKSAGLFLEDGVEHFHAVDNRMTRRFSCLHGERKAESKHKALAILRRPELITMSADRTSRRRRHFLSPRAPKTA